MSVFRLVVLLGAVALTALDASNVAEAAPLKLCWENLSPDHAAQISMREWSNAAQMESNLDLLWQQCLEEQGSDAEKCERYGVFGPDSMIWEVGKVTFVAIFAQYQLFMELAHPPSIQGVMDWSPALKYDPVRRFMHTLDVLWRILYGSFSEAREKALKMHRIHSRIVGTMDEGWGGYQQNDVYSALDPESQLWIHTTFWYAVLKSYETLERRLTGEERDRYYADTKKFGMIMGIRPDRIPGSADEFQRYFGGMINSGKLHVTDSAAEYARQFRERSQVASAKQGTAFALVSSILWNSADAISAELMPPGLADRVGIRRGLRQHLTYRASLAAAKAAWMAAPLMAKVNPLYNMGRQRALQEPVTVFDFIDEWFYGKLIGLGHKRR